MPSAGSSAGGAGGSGPTVKIPIIGDVVNESDISREIYNAFALALGKVFTSPAFSKGMLRMGTQMGKQMERAFAKSAATMSKTLTDVLGKGAASASGKVSSSMSHMVPHNLTAAIDRLIGQFNRLETAAKKASTPDINMERVLERLNRQATVATTEGARQQTAALNSALQAQAAATNASAKQRVAIIQAMSNQIRALERGIGAAIKFSLDLAGKAAHALGAALRGIGNAAQAGARASAAAMRGIVTAVQSVIRGVARLSTGLASGFARGFGAVSRALSGALRRDEGALRSSLSRRERMVSQSATRQGGILSRIGAGGLLGGLAGGAGIGSLLTSGFERAGAEERLGLTFTTLLEGDADAAKTILADLSDYAWTTSFDFVELGSSAAQVLAVMGDPEQATDFVKWLSDITALTGGGTEQFGRARLAFTQLLSSGRLEVQELNQLTESLPGIPFGKILADAFFGGDQAAFQAARRAGELGDISAEEFMAALNTGLAEEFPGLEGTAVRLAGTLSGMAANLKENFAIFGAQFIRLVEGPIKSTIGFLNEAMGTIGGFISGDMFAPQPSAENPFAAMADDALIAFEELPAALQKELEDNFDWKAGEGFVMSAEDAEAWWNRMNPPEADETLERLKELRTVIGDFVKGTGLILGLAAAFKVLGSAFNFVFRPQSLGRFGLLVRAMLPLVVIGGGLGVVWGRLMKSSGALRSSVGLVRQAFGNLFGTFKQTLGIVGGLLSNAIFGDSDFFKNLGDKVSGFTNTVGRLVNELNGWLKWANDMLAKREFGKVIDSASQSIQGFVASILGLTDAQQEAAQALGGNDFGNIFTAFLDKLEDVPVLGPIIRFVRRIVDAISGALAGVGGFFTDMWDNIFGGGTGTGEEGGLSAMEEKLFGTESEQRSMGTRILDTLEDTFLGPVVRFFRGPFADGVESAISGISSFVGGVISWVDEGGLGRAWTAVSGFFAPIFNTIADTVTSVWARIQPIVQPLIDAVTELIDAFKDWDFSEIDVGELVRNALIGGIAGFAIGGLPGLAIGGLAGVLFDPLVESIGNAWDMEIRPALEGVFDKLKAWFSSTFTAENLGGAATFILDFFREAGNLVADIATDEKFVGAVAGVAAAGTLIVLFFTLGLIEGLADGLLAWTELIGNALESAWEAIAPEFIPDPITNAISAVLGNAVSGGLALLGAGLLGGAIVKAVIGGITTLGPALIAGAGGLAGMIFGRGRTITGGATLGVGQDKTFSGIGSAMAASIAAGFLAYKFGEAAGESGSTGGIILSLLTGGATGAMLGTAIGGPGLGTAIGAILGTAAAGLGAFFGNASREAKEARESTQLYLDVLNEVGKFADPSQQLTGALSGVVAGESEAIRQAFIDAEFDFQGFVDSVIDGSVDVQTAYTNILSSVLASGEPISREGTQAIQDFIDDVRQLEDADFTRLNIQDLLAGAPEAAAAFSDLGFNTDEVLGLFGLLTDESGTLEGALSEFEQIDALRVLADDALSLEEAVGLVNDALADGQSAAQIQAMLEAEGVGPTQALEVIATASEGVRDAAQEAKAALDEIFETQVSPDTIVGATAQIISGITSINFEGLNLNVPEGNLANEADVELIRQNFAGQVEDAINSAVASGVVVDEAGVTALLGRISTAIDQAPDLTAGERDFLQEILDSYSPTETDYSTVFDPLATATVNETTLAAVAAGIEADMAPPIETGMTNAINTAGGMAFSTMAAPGSPVMAAITSAAQAVGTQWDTELTAAMSGVGAGGGTAAVGITPAPDDAGGIGSGLISSVVSAIEAGAGAVEAAGLALGVNFAAGIRGAARSARAAALAAAVVAAAGFSRGRDAARQMGQTLALSFALGIRSMASAVASAAAAIANAAIQAARSVLRISSPSKVFVGIGQQIGEGFMAGIEETEGDMASALSEAIGEAIDKVEQTAVSRAAEVGTAIFSAMIPAAFPGATPTSTITSARAAINQQIGAFRVGAQGTAAGTFGGGTAGAAAAALQTLQGIYLDFAAARADLNEELAAAKEHRAELAEWDAASAKRREELGDRPDELSFRERDILAFGAGSLNLGTFAGQANADAINESLGAIQDWATAAVEAGTSTTTVANQVDAYVAKLRRQAIASGLTASSVDKLIQAMGLSVAQINTWQTSLITLNSATAAGQANIQMINEQLEAIRDYGLSLVEAGYSAATVQTELVKLRNSLITQATAFGFNRTQIDALVAAAGLANDQLAQFVAEMAAFTAEAKNAAAAAAAAAKAAADKAAAEELAAQEAAAAAITPIGRPVVENLNVYLPYGDPEAAGLAAANHIAYSTLTAGNDMPGPFHGWLLIEDNQGNAYEVINQARTAEYLSNPALALNEVSICNILDFGGCETYAMGPDSVVVSGGYLDFPGTPSGNYATVPSGAIPSGGADMTVIAAVAADDWSPAAKATLASRSNSTGNRRGWALSLNTAGTLEWMWSNNGTAELTATSSANLSALSNGTKRWVAVTFDADNGAAGRSVRFWTSTDGVTYSALGTVQTSATATTINATTAKTAIAALNEGASQLFSGNVYEVSIRHGIGAAGVVTGSEAFEVFHFDGNTNLAGFNTSRTAPWTVVTTLGDPMTIYSAGSPGTVVHEAVTACDLVAQTYSTPALDDAPWYNADYPESADALGFYVSEWTGLDDGHVRRATGPRGSAGGGSTLGVVSAEGRTMALNIMLFARTEAAMDYLFRWLSNTLNSVCSTCATSSMLIRRYCGTTADPWNGVVELRQVGVIQGLKWESDVGTRARCYIRRASFTLMAGDPCMYLPSSDAPTHVDDYDEDLDAFFTTDNPADDTRSTCRPSCSELTANARTSRTVDVSTMGATSLVVTWENNNADDTYTYPFRAVVYHDPMGVGTDSPNPCGLQVLGQLYVRALPPSTAMRWDVTGRTVEFRDPSTGGWTPSWTYVDANDPPYRRFFTLPCGVSHLVMEPASMCSTTDDSVTWELDGVEFSPIAFPTVDVALSERISCP